MPPLPNAPQALRAKYSGTYNQTDWVNVFYLSYAGTTPTQADLDTLATGLRAAWLASLAPLIVSSCSLTYTEVLDVSRNPGAIGANNTVAVGVGSAPGFPAQVSMCISKKVARRYRGGHPRLYMPGVPSGHSTDGRTLIAAIVTLANTNAKAWRTAINALTTASTGAVALANVSYYYTPTPGGGSQLRPTPIVEPISDCVVNARVDTQRRRLD